jgi:hypothetical protein
MFWAIDLDDFSGAFCKQGKYPLMNIARSEILNPTLASPRNLKEKSVFCMLDMSAILRRDEGQFFLEDIDIELCSHLVLVSAEIVKGLVSTDYIFETGFVLFFIKFGSLDNEFMVLFN